MAATVPVEKEGDVNPLLEAAHRIGEDHLGDENETPPKTKTVIPSLAEFNPENPPIPDNGNASFERFMGSFGAPARWAGR